MAWVRALVNFWDLTFSLAAGCQLWPYLVLSAYCWSLPNYTPFDSGDAKNSSTVWLLCLVLRLEIWKPLHQSYETLILVCFTLSQNININCLWNLLKLGVSGDAVNWPYTTAAWYGSLKLWAYCCFRALLSSVLKESFWDVIFQTKTLKLSMEASSVFFPYLGPTEKNQL